MSFQPGNGFAKKIEIGNWNFALTPFNFMKPDFITNFCPFYCVKLFKILADKIGTKFLF